MDSSSSSVGFPRPGNLQSLGNPPPLHSSSVGIPNSENPQSTENSQIPQNRRFSCNGAARITAPAEEWNVALARLFSDDNFCMFMRGGECEEYFKDWYNCMHFAFYGGGNPANCSALAGTLRDCIYSNLQYHHPLLTYFWDQSRR